MKSIQFAGAIAITVLACTAAYAGDEQSFSALQGVEAQALSSSEMNAVYGQLTIDEIKAAVIAKVQNPVLEAYLLAQIDHLVATYPNAVARVLAFLTARGY
ncbi:hypothetical protein HHL11_11910 [Ramlibacter sp. G-1-2-2]|uniref:DUF2059 domain-containing protein n=1 Tax=Ramlibacter agri TaxID=2728837 RepID=A0A848H5E0_9BURK|nr:hypothetical protein [Ramlibacter agri]NML44460.1 hypothetical protein [Ramlibacter agri]